MKNDDAFQEVRDTLFFFFLLVLLGPQEEKVLFFSLVRILSASGNNMCKERFRFTLLLAGSQVFRFRLPG